MNFPTGPVRGIIRAMTPSTSDIGLAALTTTDNGASTAVAVIGAVAVGAVAVGMATRGRRNEFGETPTEEKARLRLLQEQKNKQALVRRLSSCGPESPMQRAAREYRETAPERSAQYRTGPSTRWPLAVGGDDTYPTVCRPPSDAWEKLPSSDPNVQEWTMRMPPEHPAVARLPKAEKQKMYYVIYEGDRSPDGGHCYDRPAPDLGYEKPVSVVIFFGSDIAESGCKVGDSYRSGYGSPHSGTRVLEIRPLTAAQEADQRECMSKWD